jgi:hypothetical protein
MPRKHSGKKSKKLIDYETRKSVHISLVKATHTELRKLLFDKGLSMQQVFNRFASMLCEGDEYLEDILDYMVQEKNNKHIKKVTTSDSDTLFDIISEVNPFEEEEDE